MKCIFQYSWHNILTFDIQFLFIGSRTIPVPDTVALLHHYRICEFGGFACLKKPNLVDRTANKFGQELLRRGQEQCRKIYPDLEGRCPISPPLGSPW